MKKVTQKQVTEVLNEWVDFIDPKGQSPTEAKKLCGKAGVTYAALKALRSRKSMSSETAIRFFIASGVAIKDLVRLPKTNKSALSPAELKWIELGRNLNEKEKLTAVEVVEYLRGKYKLK